ncbi:MAG: septal ring lytic transglycosylase RlpA family protein [Aquaticitalea sp.]
MKFILKIVFSLVFLTVLSSFKSSRGITQITDFNPIIVADTTKVDSSLLFYKPYKENAHASYYHDKFNGRKTASGELFDNNLYTAAHKTLKFGTKIRVTNTVNDSSVVVTVNDRGPFAQGREIDLSKKAFMEIAKFKQRGFLIVSIEILEE